MGSNPWLKLGLNSLALGMEAQSVVALRMVKLAGGGTEAAAEAQLMVLEKVQASVIAYSHLALGLATGGGLAGARKAQNHVRRAVRANRRRLQRPSQA